MRGLVGRGLDPDPLSRLAAVYAVPGLYEHLFYERLKGQSPAVVSALLAEAVEAEGDDPAALPVLDLGAGNGMVGEALREHGFEEITGVDITPEAGEAVERDRPACMPPTTSATCWTCPRTPPRSSARRASAR